MNSHAHTHEHARPFHLGMNNYIDLHRDLLYNLNQTTESEYRPKAGVHTVDSNC